MYLSVECVKQVFSIMHYVAMDTRVYQILTPDVE